MKVFSTELRLATTAGTDILDLTSDLRSAAGESGLGQGQITVFVPGSFSAVIRFYFLPYTWFFL